MKIVNTYVSKAWEGLTAGQQAGIWVWNVALPQNFFGSQFDTVYDAAGFEASA